MNIEVVIVVIIVAFLAATLGYFFSYSKSSRTKQDLALSRQHVDAFKEQNAQLQDTATEAKQQIEQMQSSLSEKERALSAIDAKYNAEKEKTEERTRELATLRSVLEEAKQTILAIQTENAELRTSQSAKEEHHKQQIEQFEGQKTALKIEFENLANKIFETKGQAFTEKNKASLDELLNPFKAQIKDFKEKVEDIHHKDTQQQSELKTELKHLQELNQKITEEAHGLATALKGQKKMQGNWGEMILENVLDRSGLVKGKDYNREVSINTEEGRSRPDAIVYLPDSKHLIIDAKVSLNAYTRYVNAEDDLEREQELAAHVSAVSDRIKELSDRNYFDLPGLNSPDMVFMFIPIESAFVEAMKADESIFQEALELNVLVATPTTLLTSLNIVRQLWRFEDQNKHTAELAVKASKMYDKLRSFVGSMEGVGKALNRAKTSYDAAYGQLTSGRANLIKQANEFKQLGVSVKTELPEHLIEKAELEINHQPQLEDNSEETSIDVSADLANVDTLP